MELLCDQPRRELPYYVHVYEVYEVLVERHLLVFHLSGGGKRESKRSVDVVFEERALHLHFEDVRNRNTPAPSEQT